MAHIQVEGGGVVQGVTKLISTKLKMCLISFQKMGLIFHLKEVNSFSKIDEKKSNTLQKILFSHYVYNNKKH